MSLQFPVVHVLLHPANSVHKRPTTVPGS